MISIHQTGRLCLFLGFAAAISTTASGQDSIRARSLAYGSPFAGAPVLNAPFSADATIKFTRTLDDGTLIERLAKARYYRDSAGHVRAEWVDIGLGAQNRTAGRYTSIWVMRAMGGSRDGLIGPDVRIRLSRLRYFTVGNGYLLCGWHRHAEHFPAHSTGALRTM